MSVKRKYKPFSKDSITFGLCLFLAGALVLSGLSSEALAFSGSSSNFNITSLHHGSSTASSTSSSSYNLTSFTGTYEQGSSLNASSINYQFNLGWLAAQAEDTTSPTVILINPVSDYYNDSSDPVNVSFNCSASDDNNLVNISLYITDSSNSSFGLNQTTNISGVSDSTTWTLSLGNGNYTWNCLAYDNASQVGWGENNRTIKINYSAAPPANDTTAPLVRLISPTDNQAFNTTNNVTFNVSAADNVDLDNCTLYTNVTGSWQANETKIYSGTDDSDIWIFYNLDNGTYIWNTLCYDNSSNSAWNSTNFTFTVAYSPTAPPADTTPPASVINLENISATNSSILWNWTDPVDADFNSTIIYIDSSNVINLSAGTTQYNAAGFGANTTHTITIHTKDHTGNVNNTDVNSTAATLSDEIPQITDTTLPTVILNSPIDNYNTSLQQITFNCTAYDNIKVENVTLYGNWSGSWQADETNSSGLNNTGYIFSKTIDDGSYIWNCYSCDNSSNCASASANRTFAIDSTAPWITNVQNTSITNGSAVITWDTDELSNSSVEYGTSQSLGTISSLDDSVTSHSISLAGLSENTTYYYNVTSCDNLGSCNTSGIFNFTTTTTVDNRSPAITNAQAASITNQSAVITWDTDESSNSSVNYGTGINLGMITGQNDAVTAHSVSLTGLTNNTLYYYNVTSCDPSANCNTSGTYNFTTQQTDTPPVVALISPADNYNSANGSIAFECNAADDNSAANITLYTNISGAWQANYTVPGDSLSYTINGITDGHYTWNCLAYDNTSQSDWGINRTFNVTLDSDGDGVLDGQDTLEGDESSVATTGVSNLNITVGGNTANGTFSGEQEVVFYDGADALMNFSHNFSAAEIDLSRISIEVTSLSIVVNLSGQLLADEKKSLYITDNSFISLCIKDAEITFASEISADCNGAGETDFTSCLGDNTGTAINNIICYDEGDRIMVENLSYSGVKGAQAVAQQPSGGGGGYSCTSVWQCTAWSECDSSGTRTRICTDIRNCRVQTNKPDEVEACTYVPAEEPIEKAEEEMAENVTGEIEEEQPIEEKPIEIQEKEQPIPLSLPIILIILLFIIVIGATARRYAQVRTLGDITGQIGAYLQKEKSLGGGISKDKKFISNIRLRINRLKEEKEREMRAINLLKDVKNIDLSAIKQIEDEIDKIQAELKRTSAERDKIGNALKFVLDKENELIHNRTKLIEQKEKLEHQKESLFFKFEKYGIAVPGSMQNEILPRLNSIGKEIGTISDILQGINKKRSKLMQKKKEFDLSLEGAEAALKDKQKAYELADRELETTQKRIKEVGIKRVEEVQLLRGLAEQKKKKLQDIRKEKGKLKEIKIKENQLIEQAGKLGKEELISKIEFVKSIAAKNSRETKGEVEEKIKDIHKSAKTWKYKILPAAKKTKMSEKKKQMLKELKEVYQ